MVIALFRTLIFFLAAAFVISPSSGQSADEFIRGGEFAAAEQAASYLPASQRDQLLAQIATTQASLGNPSAAAATVRSINSPSARRETIDDIQQTAAGGGSFADFQSLMALIETTIVPDTWETLGGPSTMAPYPQGVMVDSQGTLQEVERVSRTRWTDEISTLLDPSIPQLLPSDATTVLDPLAWRRSAKLRFVSLRRLRDTVTEQQLAGTPISDSLRFVAGLSDVRYVFLTDSDDVVIAGEVGGIEQHEGWYRDRRTAKNTLRLDFLLECFAAANEQRSFGCTIDPTEQGMRRSAEVAERIRDREIPIGKAAETLKAALGMQRVEVFNVRPNTAMAQLMVEADRHMKQLALGVHPMPEAAENYLDAINAWIGAGTPNDLLLRLWFTASPRSLRSNSEQTVFEITGTPIRLSGQNQRTDALGQRGQPTVDPRTEQFVASFNQHWNRVSQRYPIYSALESIYQASAVAELISRHAVSPQQKDLSDSLAMLELPSAWTLPAARQVDSIAVMHHVREGNQQHHVLIASGGVLINSQDTLPRPTSQNAALESTPPPSNARTLLQRWWWDLDED